MPSHEQQIRVRHRPDELFDLVSDVRSYPDFIPFISALRVLKENRPSPDLRVMEAEASVGYKFIRERFATHVELRRPELKIDVSYLSGPFEALSNQWRFHELSDGTTLIDFRVSYEFRNKLLKVMFEGARDRAATMILNAFSEEAERRYETIGAPTIDLSSEPAYSGV